MTALPPSKGLVATVGHVPEPGETVRCQGLEFHTERVEGRRIAMIAIRPVHDADAEPVANGNGERSAEASRTNP